ncbi:serine/threonine protein kinase, partial [Streptomyces sp. 12257]|nr:serine/threonine protein kinase [Streptomyces sp. 12257]
TSLPTWAAEELASPPAAQAPAPAPVLTPADAPDPTPATHEPRRITALSALGLLLQKKPERG